jgi:arylsulfatase A-like enzyme
MASAMLVLGMLITIAPPSTAQTSRPNIIFVFPDDHATHAVSAYGSKINETPHLDRLAREGMLFRNAFVTNSICAPARAVVLTGKHSHLNGVYDNGQVFDGSQVTFPKLLRDAGYQTAIIGKWHLKSEPTGFDYWKVLPGQGDYYNPAFLTPDGRVEETGYVTDIITDETLEWLETGRDPNKPFMLMYPHKAPHRTWAPGPNHLTMYDGEKIAEPSTLFDDHAGRASVRRTQTMTIAEHLTPRDLKLDSSAGGNRLTPEQRRAWDAAYQPKNEEFLQANLEGDDLVRWKYQRYIKDYLRTVASIDDNLGRLLDYLDESGLAENTVVVYSSDQGFFLGDHGWYDKRWMYEESLRTPLVVRWPGVVRPGSENADLVQNLDFAQTFLEIAGASADRSMQGRSLVPLLMESTPDDWRTSIYYHYYEFPAVHCVARHYGIRTDRYKLIHFYQHNEWELFDLQEDPDELINLYSNPKHAGIGHELKQALTGLRQAYQVPETDPEDVGRPDLAASGECVEPVG